jgi:hypothetical protein
MAYGERRERKKGVRYVAVVAVGEHLRIFGWSGEQVP